MNKSNSLFLSKLIPLENSPFLFPLRLLCISYTFQDSVRPLPVLPTTVFNNTGISAHQWVQVQFIEEKLAKSHAVTLHAGTCTYPGYSSIHHLEADEWISAVAKSCNVEEESLESANSQIPDVNNVTAGLPVCIPPQCCSVLTCSQGNALTPAPSLSTSNGKSL